jgi:hypothetical protein
MQYSSADGAMSADVLTGFIREQLRQARHATRAARRAPIALAPSGSTAPLRASRCGRQ